MKLWVVIPLLTAVIIYAVLWLRSYDTQEIRTRPQPHNSARTAPNHTSTQHQPRADAPVVRVEMPAQGDDGLLPVEQPEVEEPEQERGLFPVEQPEVEEVQFQDLLLKKNDVPPSPADPPLKKILYWNEIYGNKHFGLGFGREPFLRARCRVNTCTATGNRTLYPYTALDAVIWHYRSNDQSFPPDRSPHTRYVFWVIESASYLTTDLRRYNKVFNWTMTYRLDSDFPHPYGKVYRRALPLAPEQRDYVANKTKMAAWFVSNCHTHSGREQLVKTLRQWIKIDVYGLCGEMSCARSENANCNNILNAHYKFYLAFENSLCRDYITEKFFQKLRLNVVPVVYGMGPYSIHAPPKSYIDALSFPSARALADYLIYLDTNNTAYNEYFEWKRTYRIANEWRRKATPFCELCEALHTDRSTKEYDMRRWYVTDSHCQTSRDRRIAGFIRG